MFENQSELASFIRNHPSFEDFFDTSSFSHMMTYPYEGVFIAFFLSNCNEIDAQITGCYSNNIDKTAIWDFIDKTKSLLENEVRKRNL